MTLNEGTFDRTVRVILGILLVVLWPLGALSGWWAVAAVVVGAALLITGATGTCFLYRVFGISTRRERRSG